MIDLTGKVALVTGGGRGIGRATVDLLRLAGADVMVNDLEPLEGVTFAGDITDAQFTGRLVAETVDRFGGLDIVVNNAGYTWDNVIQKTTDEQFQAMLDVHLVAPFRILRAASEFIRAAAKREAAEGRRVQRKVVNITSISGTDGGAGQAGYASGKAGVIGLTKTLAKEWGRYCVNVNAVGFGLIETRLTQPLRAESTIEVGGREIRVGVQPQVLDQVIAASPLGRAGTPEEAAGAVLFFCSPLSDFVTGEVLMCSGGMRF